MSRPKSIHDIIAQLHKSHRTFREIESDLRRELKSSDSTTVEHARMMLSMLKREIRNRKDGLPFWVEKWIIGGTPCYSVSCEARVGIFNFKTKYMALQYANILNASVLFWQEKKKAAEDEK